MFPLGGRAAVQAAGSHGLPRRLHRSAAAPASSFMARTKYDALPEARKVIDDNSGEAQSRAAGVFFDGFEARALAAVKAMGGHTIVSLNEAQARCLEASDRADDRSGQKRPREGARTLQALQDRLAAARGEMISSPRAGVAHAMRIRSMSFLIMAVVLDRRGGSDRVACLSKPRPRSGEGRGLHEQLVELLHHRGLGAGERDQPEQVSRSTFG